MIDSHNTIAQQETSSEMQQRKPQKPTIKEWIRPLWFLTSIGWYVALSLVIPTGIGYWLDRPENMNTHPLLTLIGFGLGTIIAFYGLYRMLRSFYKEQRGKNKEAN